jgi:hypothetical protein
MTRAEPIYALARRLGPMMHMAAALAERVGIREHVSIRIKYHRSAHSGTHPKSGKAEGDWSPIRAGLQIREKAATLLNQSR